MFMDTSEILICQHCNKKYDEPKLLPCGNTVCNGCIKALSSSKKEKKKTPAAKKPENVYDLISNEFKCLMCEDNHEFPVDKRFPTNQHLLKLLNKDLKLFNFGESAEKLKTYVHSLQTNKLELQELALNGREFIADYCKQIRSDIESATEKEVQCIYKRHEELLAEARFYEKETIDVYEKNKDRFHQKQSLNDLFRRVLNFEQNQSKLDVLEATRVAKDLDDKIKELKEKLTHFLFNGNVMKFHENKNSSAESVGILEYSN